MHLSGAAHGEGALAHAHAIQPRARYVRHVGIHIHHKAVPACRNCHA